MTEIRSFNRTDREQLTESVNAHIAVVVPGWAVPVAALLGQLEREPGEYVVDPWVMERMTLVSVVQDRVVAGAHLKRYAADPRVSEGYADSAGITWLVCWPENVEAGHALAQACVRVLEAWGGRHQWADGALPTPATYGVADAWPHVRAILERAGFRDEGAQTEVHLADGSTTCRRPAPRLSKVWSSSASWGTWRHGSRRDWKVRFSASRTCATTSLGAARCRG